MPYLMIILLAFIVGFDHPSCLQLFPIRWIQAIISVSSINIQADSMTDRVMAYKLLILEMPN